MKRDIELLAPGGDIDSIKAAIIAGADAVYCGLNKFNARNRAANISFEDLQGILRLAHQHHCQVFLTLNIIVLDSEIPALFKLLNRLVNTSIDGVIVQDLGMLYLLSTYFNSLKIHASTQLTTHNEGQIQFLSKLNIDRLNLSRELNIHEIKSLTKAALKKDILTEVFMHGSYCISFSGICYMSSLMAGKSGNRGMCSQPCRDRYETTAAGKNYPLNLKDNSAYFDLRELSDAGVSSLKIEGRIKEFEYVYTVVNSWRKQLNHFYNENSLLTDNNDLYKVFNRDFSNGFLKGDIHKDMFIDNPMSHSTTHHHTKDPLKLYEEKAELRTQIKDQIDRLNIEKLPLIIRISGQDGEPLKLEIGMPDTSFVIYSKTNLAKTNTQVLNKKMVLKRFKAFNDTEYYIQDLIFENLDPGVFISFNELTSLKKRVLFVLNGNKEMIDPMAVPIIKKPIDEAITARLSVLISSPKDIHLCEDTSAKIYFQLPNDFKNEAESLIDLFKKYNQLIPYFPSILLGEDYTAAVKFLHRVNPTHIVTNNTGIAFEAYTNKIPWIAGPYLNSINSFSLLCLKENFNCMGAFISNEIGKKQIENIKKPEDFNLYYSIYHPIVLMTSRQCLFHQVTGCEKNKIDNSCIQKCEKSSSIRNLKKENFIIEKAKGNYHHVYNETNFLNTEIIRDLPNVFSSFFIDLRDIKTNTKVEIDKESIIQLFIAYLNGNDDAKIHVQQQIHPTTNTQYTMGI